jgi:hypothetical protein
MASTKRLALGALAALCIPAFCANAQPFNAVYGIANGNDFGRQAHEIHNGPLAGDFIAVGETPQPSRPAVNDVYVVVTNPGGARVAEWAVDLINSDDYGKDFVETSTGNIVIVGNFFAVGQTTSDIFAMEFDASTGAVIWANAYSGSTPSGNFNDEAYDIEDVGNGYVVAGRSNSLHITHNDAILFKIDQSGAWRWGTAFDGSVGSDDGFYSVTQLGNGNLMGAGYTHAGGSADIFLAQVNGFGNLSSAMRYGGPNDEGVRSIKSCDLLGPNANRVILCGNTGPSSSSVLALVDYTTMGFVNGFSYKTPLAGWTEGMGVVETPSPEYKFVMSGLTFDPQGIGNDYEFYISRVDTKLAIVDWYHIHGGQLPDQGWSVDLATPLPGDLYSIIAAGLRTTNAMQQQLDLTHTSQFGSMPCDEQVTPDITPLQFTANAMTNCQTLWGLLLQGLSPRAVSIATPFIFCPPANFSTRKADPTFSLENYVNGGHDALVGADTTYLPQIRAMRESRARSNTPSTGASAAPATVHRSTSGEAMPDVKAPKSGIEE